MRFLSGDYASLTRPEKLLRAVVNLLTAPFLLLSALLGQLLHPSVQGVLEGFDAHDDGKHYPRFFFDLPDGRRIRRTDTALALEDAVAPAQARRILRRRYPRPITVTYHRRHPERCSCRYL